MRPHPEVLGDVGPGRGRVLAAAHRTWCHLRPPIPRRRLLDSPASPQSPRCCSGARAGLPPPGRRLCSALRLERPLPRRPRGSALTVARPPLQRPLRAARPGARQGRVHLLKLGGSCVLLCPLSWERNSPWLEALGRAPRSSLPSLALRFRRGTPALCSCPPAPTGVHRGALRETPRCVPSS